MTLDIAEARAAFEANALAAFDPTVPGLPGDGTPTLLHVDHERGLAYRWHNISPRVQDFTSRDRGYLVSRLSVTLLDQPATEVGHLNVTSTTRELVTSVFPTPFHWADANTGAIFGFGLARKHGTAAPTPEKIWATSYNYLSQQPASMAGKRYWTLSASDAPDDPEVLAAELAIAERAFARLMRGFLRWLATPFVDYAHLDHTYTRPDGTHAALRGTGVGRQMYLLAARHLAASRGKPLRASGVQTDYAQSLWARLVADPTVPTRRTRLTYFLPAEQQTNIHWCLDYTR